MKHFSIQLFAFITTLFLLPVGLNAQTVLTISDSHDENFVTSTRRLGTTPTVSFSQTSTRFDLFFGVGDFMGRSYYLEYEVSSGVPMQNLELRVDNSVVQTGGIESLTTGNHFAFSGEILASALDPGWCATSNIRLTIVDVKSGWQIWTGDIFKIIWEDYCSWKDVRTHQLLGENPLVSTAGVSPNYGMLALGSWKVFYAAQNGEHESLYNIYQYGNWGFCNNTANPGSEKDMSENGTNIVSANEGIYFVNDDQKITKATWSQASNWTYTAVNNNAHQVMNNSHIEVDGDKVFYVGSDGHVRNIFGSTWQHGALNTSAPTARANSDLVVGGDKVWYVDGDHKVRYFEWQGSQWNSVLANSNAVDAKPGTEMAYGDGNLFYIGTDDKVRRINGTGLFDHGVVNTNAPLAHVGNRMGMAFENDHLFYFDENRHIHNIYKSGSFWLSAPVTGCGVKGKFGSPISIYNDEVWYVNENTNQPHKQVWSQCSAKFGGDEDSEASEGLLSIFPNPSQGQFTISNPSEGTVGYTIYNMAGQAVAHGVVDAQTQNDLDLGTTAGNGMYMLQWQNTMTGEGATERIIVQ